jgi:hypothetical protein
MSNPINPFMCSISSWNTPKLILMLLIFMFYESELNPKNLQMEFEMVIQRKHCLANQMFQLCTTLYQIAGASLSVIGSD